MTTDRKHYYLTTQVYFDHFISGVINKTNQNGEFRRPKKYRLFL